MELGTLEESDGRYRLRFTRVLPHPPEKVWKAITESEHVNAWFPAEIHGERRAGAELQFVFTEDEGPTLPGEMIVFDPPSVLEFRWDTELLRFELEPAGDGTVLRFVNTFDDVGKAARDAAGWHSCLDVLERHMAGEEPPVRRWEEVHPLYVEAFGPEAATVGPPEGH